MLRRLRLPGTLAIAAVPLIALLAAVTAQFTLQTLDRADQQDYTAELAGLWEPLQSAIDMLADEERATLGALESLSAQEVSAMRGAADLSEVRIQTDEAMSALRSDLRRLGDPEPLLRQHQVATDGIVAVRAFFDESGTSPDTQRIRIPEGYDLVDAQLLEIGDLVVAEVEDVELGRDLAAISSLSQAIQSASIQDRTIELLEPGDRLRTSLETVRRSDVELTQWLSAFESASTEEWRLALRDSAVPPAVFDASRLSGQIVRSGDDAIDLRADGWGAVADARRQALSEFQESRITSLVRRSTATAADVRSQAFAVLAVIVGAMVVALLVTALVARSIVRRVRSVTDSARHVAQEQLPALVEVLRDPREDVTLPSIPPIRDRGADEVGDLARSFSAMQSTLEHVAGQQIDVLRKGVSDMFVTLARRNRSLIDRQLAMIDSLEQREEDPKTLAEFYRLDHLATRMRRNAESLLVLAGSESKKKWSTPLEIDDVVRAAIGEVEDYRRIDVLALESVRLEGRVVTDVAHLLSELLENATSFSAPETRVRIAGHFHDGGYLITVTDRGVGIPSARLVELNALLESPPVVGLALEPTLGIYVVAMLAKRHSIGVRLVTGAPGLTAQIVLPDSLFAPEALPEPAPRPTTASPRVEPSPGPRHRIEPTDVNREARPRQSVAVASGLPQRRPGTSYSGGGEGDAVSRSPRDPAAVRDDLASFQARASSTPTGRGDADPHPTNTDSRGGDEQVPTAALRPPGPGGDDGGPGLPTRRPGTSYAEPEVAERSVEASQRDPAELKSAFSAYQLGMTVGRGSSEGEQHE